MIRSALRAAWVFSLPCAFLACNSNDKTASAAGPGLASFSKDSLVAAIKTLASDEFQGRRPFTAGETKTIDYLVNAYTALGLEPGNGNGYTQDVPMVEISPAAPSSLRFNSPKGSVVLQNLTDFVCWTEKPDTLNSLPKNDVLFTGFRFV